MMLYFFCTYMCGRAFWRSAKNRKKKIWKCINKYADNAYNVLKIIVFKDYLSKICPIWGLAGLKLFLYCKLWFWSTGNVVTIVELSWPKLYSFKIINGKSIIKLKKNTWSVHRACVKYSESFNLFGGGGVVSRNPTGSASRTVNHNIGHIYQLVNRDCEWQ